MRRLVAALVVGIALFGAVYLGSRNLGGSVVRCIDGPYMTLGGRPPNPCRTGLRPALFAHSQAGWQIPVSVLIGVLGAAAGSVVLRTRPEPPLGNSTQTA